MIKLTGLKNWILPVYQDNLLDYDTRLTVLYGGSGSGKSYYAVQKSIIKSLRMKRKTLVIRKVSATIRDSIWSLFLEELGSMPQVIKSINRTAMMITLVNDSVFLFKGLDDPEKLKSINGITDAIVEEASELTLDDFTQLNLRLRAKAPYLQMTLMFNPISKANWTYSYFFADKPPENCKILRTTYKDNPHLPESYIATLLELQNRNPNYYKIYALGEFATLDKLIFSNWKKDLVNVDAIKQDSYFWVGLDFGYTNDPTALTWGYYHPEGKRLWITGEYTAKGLTNDRIAEIITKLGLSKERIVADSAEQKSIAEIRRYGVNHIMAAQKGPNSILTGLDQLLRCEIVIDERCSSTIEEFENYTWRKDKSTGEYINEPIDSFNHHIDSIRYGIQPVIKKKVRDLNYVPLIG